VQAGVFTPHQQVIHQDPPHHCGRLQKSPHLILQNCQLLLALILQVLLSQYLDDELQELEECVHDGEGGGSEAQHDDAQRGARLRRAQ